MNQKANEIEKLIKEQQQTNIGAMRTNNLLESEKRTAGNQLEDILEKLRKDRIEINKIINQPNESSAAEDGYKRQLSNYLIYFSWILLVVISVGLAAHLISSESVSVITYIFVAIWIIILAKYYYKQVAYYTGWAVDSISSLMVDTVN